MLRKRLSIVFLVLMILSLLACRRGVESDMPTPAGTAITLQTAAASDVTAIAATSTIATAAPAATATGATQPATVVPGTATSVPPTIAPPTVAPAAATVNAGPPPGGSTRITFAPGATSATVQSNLAAGGDGDTWLLRVAAGQVVTVQTIANPPGNVIVSLLDMNGSTLATNPDTIGISAAVPATGDYQINLATASGAPAVGYTMQVLIPAAGGPVAPTRIQFAPGQAAAQLADTLAAGGDLNAYVVRVGAGQTIQVGVFASPPAVTNIYIRDTAGRLLTSGTDMSGGVSATASAAGDYFIDVSNFNAAPAVSYTLTVTVPPLNPPPPVQPIRIEFGPGQTSAELYGQVAVGLPPVEYVIRAGAGQTLITTLSSNPEANADLTVRDMAGTVLNFGRSPTELGTTIPASGDYIIVVSTMSTNAVQYTLRVTVPPLPATGETRIEFAPGATSATVTGDLPFGGDLDTWVIRALAGQTMNVALGVNEATGWVKVYVYNAANQLIASGTDVSGAAAPLAATGDYRIVVNSDQAAGPLSYSLTVDVR